MAYDQERHTELSIKKATVGLSEQEQTEYQILQEQKRQQDLVKVINKENK